MRARTGAQLSHGRHGPKHVARVEGGSTIMLSPAALRAWYARLRLFSTSTFRLAECPLTAAQS